MYTRLHKLVRESQNDFINYGKTMKKKNSPKCFSLILSILFFKK